MPEPLRTIRIVIFIQTRDERLVTTDDDHDEQVCDHDHINETQDRKHDLTFRDTRGFVDQVQQLHHEMEDVYALRNDQSKIQWCLQPTAEKNDACQSLKRTARFITHRIFLL